MFCKVISSGNVKTFVQIIIFAAMRPLYLFIWWCLSYSLRLFYRRIKLFNPPKFFFGRTIYVSNHAASFMDPLVVACFRKPIVFFMTRSDVFTPLSRPLLWSVHMLPIYRQLDGVNTKEKNAEVFQECSKVLKGNRNLLIFGEGFTDDVFVRRLKPIKKGAVRIGFSALEYMNWSEKVYIAGVGCNYTEPNRMRSDLLISTSESICLNDYRSDYETNPNKVISELTIRVEKFIQSQITHVANPHLTELHEEIMILTRKGMNSICYDDKIDLTSRFRYSQKLANWINNESTEYLEPLKEQSRYYFESLKKENLTDDDIWRKKNNQWTVFSDLFKFLLLIPFTILGILHCALPYLIVKRFVEKKFKRSVFWGSTKMLLSMILLGILNIPFVFIISHLFECSNWIGFFYYLLIGLFGLSFYLSFVWINRINRQIRLQKRDLTSEINARDELEKILVQTLPTELF